jgi:2-phospho-L-lactate guanylyltransferase
MRTAAVLPVKRFTHAKQRLGAGVADPLRAALARAMVGDVLLALSETATIDTIIVVTCEQQVTSAALALGAVVVEDEAESGQPAAVTRGVRRALADGLDRVLCVPGDCPALDPAELDGLLSSVPSGRREVVIVPDRHGSGTNGLLLTPPDAIPPAFGPGSCERHRALALAAGAACRVERLPSLLLDVDTSADLAALRKRLSGYGARASRTRAVLGQPEPPHIISLTTPA